MTAKGTQRRRIAWQLLGVCCLFLAARYVYLRRQPERLPWRAESRIPILHQGRAYWITETGSPPVSVIYSQLVTGGPTLQVVAADPKLKASDLTFTKDSILYTVTQRANLTGQIAGGSGRNAFKAPLIVTGAKYKERGGGNGASEFLGRFRPALQRPSAQEAAQEKRATWPKWTGPVVYQDRLRRVPITGGTPIDLGPIASGESQPTEGYVYWFAPRDSQTVQITRGNTFWSEETGHSDLMATSLSNGSSHIVRAGLPPPDDWVENTADGLFWTEPRPFPDRHHDLFYYRAADNRIYTFPDFRGSLDPPLWPKTSIFEMRGRLYWLASQEMEVPGQGTPLSWQPDHLVSANLDGSDLKTVFSWNKIRRMTSGLMVYRNAIYCLFDDVLIRSGYAPESKGRPYLCRLHLDRADPVEIVYQLPISILPYDIQIDAGYLYFMLGEVHRSFWGQLTDDNAVLKTTTTLCRIALPD